MEMTYVTDELSVKLSILEAASVQSRAVQTPNGVAG